LEVGSESYWKLKVENASWKWKLLEVEVESWKLEF